MGHVVHQQQLCRSRWEMVVVVVVEGCEEDTIVGYLSLITVFLRVF